MKLTFFFPILLLLPLLASCSEKQVYIVYFGEHNGEKEVNEIEETHHSYLSVVKESEVEARESLLYSYKHNINGFSALLTPEEASKLSKLEGVASVFRSRPRKYSLQTTRSWEFVGLLGDDGRAKKNVRGERDVIRKAKFGKDIIVGLLDTGNNSNFI
ncbi:Peptidase S8 propeptide/proteinase inhibitor I9 [Dillenia turbinata]|uniref:Peptidase S8 propeptide/proteinase inhibitor I9 n=1 Tax=Dillenia turbinata TaxID=194707 RepID=A0AAN8VDX9_9MAGN